MEKRYQVFVSSTFLDLKEERSSVIQTIMELDCIPAGMELFPAIDEEQFQFIKSVIDDCDYYIVIVGGRYGSISKDGLSYTEKEFDYAKSKGIKVIALLHKNPDEIPTGKSDTEKKVKAKLEQFREKLSEARLVKYWDKASDLPGIVALSLSKTIKMYPTIGWVRGNSIGSSELLNELNILRKENQELKDKSHLNDSAAISMNQIDDEIEFASLTDSFNLKGSYRDKEDKSNKWSVKISWKEIFYLISPLLLKAPEEESVINTLKWRLFEKENIESNGYSWVNDQDIETLKIQFIGLGLIKVSMGDEQNKSLIWELTDKGYRKMIQLRSIKK